MKTIVIYNSQTGFTKRYAQWIAEDAAADCIELSAAKTKNMDEYDAIIFGGWSRAGSISKLDWFKGNIDKWADKKLIVFCVGASPIENPEAEPTLKKNFSESELEKVNAFYCPGGLNYEEMPLPSKLMLKMLVKVLNGKKNKTDEEAGMAKMLSHSYDISDRKYIKPILNCLQK